MSESCVCGRFAHRHRGGCRVDEPAVVMRSFRSSLGPRTSLADCPQCAVGGRPCHFGHDARTPEAQRIPANIRLYRTFVRYDHYTDAMAAGETIEERFDAVTGRLNALHAQLVDLTVEVLQDPDIWGSWECRTIEKFIAWRGGVHDTVARKIVQIARRVDDLPFCLDAFRSGLLSLDQLSPIARRVPVVRRQGNLSTGEADDGASDRPNGIEVSMGHRHPQTGRLRRQHRTTATVCWQFRTGLVSGHLGDDRTNRG